MKHLTFEQILDRDGSLVYKTRGISMLPLLRQDRDLVVIKKKTDEPLKRFDVALYKRDEKYVLHRVIHVKDGRYDIRGDNTFRIEDVPEEAVLGVLTEINRNGKSIKADNPSYMRYVRFWNSIYPLRSVYHRCRTSLGRLKRKIFRKA